MVLNEEKLEEYLQLQPVSLIKQCLWVSLIFFIAAGIPTAFLGAWNEYTKFLLSPVILILCVWNIWLLIRTEKKRKAYVLFIGIYCLIFPAILVLASIKFAYTAEHFPFALYIIFSVLIYIADLILCFFYVKSTLIKVNSHKKSSKPSKAVAVIVTFSASGLIIGKIVLSFAPHRTQIIIVMMSLLVVGYILELGAHNLYKYYLIRKREQLQ